jgi:hypothetical protein
MKAIKRISMANNKPGFVFLKGIKFSSYLKISYYNAINIPVQVIDHPV